MGESNSQNNDRQTKEGRHREKKPNEKMKGQKIP